MLCLDKLIFLPLHPNILPNVHSSFHKHSSLFLGLAKYPYWDSSRPWLTPKRKQNGVKVHNVSKHPRWYWFSHLFFSQKSFTDVSSFHKNHVVDSSASFYPYIPPAASCGATVEPMPVSSADVLSWVLLHTQLLVWLCTTRTACSPDWEQANNTKVWVSSSSYFVLWCTLQLSLHIYFFLSLSKITVMVLQCLHIYPLLSSTIFSS